MTSTRRFGAVGPTRRQLMAACGVTTTAALLGCDDALSTDPSGRQPTSGATGEALAKQAPAFAERSKVGDLPAVGDRLPTAPLVLEPHEQAGTYGGTWRSALLGPADSAVLIRNIGYEPLLTWDLAFSTTLPNVAEEVEGLDSGREFVVHLRPGMKWSDGEPFTSADVLFAYNDVLANEELSPVVPDWLVIAGQPAKVDAPDETTVRFRFAEPHGLFLPRLAEPNGLDLTTRPSHYLRQFHPAYTSDAEDLAAEDGFASWIEMFEARADPWAGTELPTLNAWMITEPLGKGPRVVAERNPYYWKTDPDGAQLPYLDRVLCEVMADEEVMLLSATNGELDMHARHFNTPQNKPVLARGRESGNYDFFELTGSPNAMALFLNLTHRDPMFREAFSNKDFRIGLSHAMNRQEIIDVVYQRQGEPGQIAPRPESPLYDEGMSKQYTEYDVDLAREHLDRAGYSAVDGEGFRLLPDGRRISFQVDIPAGLFPTFPPTIELIADYWAEIGIEIRPNTIDRSFYTERRAGNLHDASVWGGGGDAPTTLSAILAPTLYFPTTADSSFAIPWANWYNCGEEPQEKPPAPARKQMELYDEIKVTLDSGEREELMRQILQIAKEEFYVMGIVVLPPGYGIVSDRFRNVPDSMPNNWRWPTPGPTRPEQYFVAEEPN